MVDFLKNIIESIGYFGVALLTFAENIIPPIPSEVVIPFSGFTARVSDLNVIGIIIAGTIGSVLGALPLYYIGYRLKEERIARLADNYLKYIGFTREDLERAMKWMHERGKWAVFLCRMVPGLRSVISIPAGIVRMPLPSFLLLTTIGTLIWTTLLALIGYALGANYEQIRPYMNAISWAVIIIGLLWYFWHILQHFTNNESEVIRE